MLFNRRINIFSVLVMVKYEYVYLLKKCSVSVLFGVTKFSKYINIIRIEMVIFFNV